MIQDHESVILGDFLFILFFSPRPVIHCCERLKTPAVIAKLHVDWMLEHERLLVVLSALDGNKYHLDLLN